MTEPAANTLRQVQRWLLAAPLVAAAACGGPQQLGDAGEPCFRDDECVAGLICVAPMAGDINRVCSNDPTPLISNVEGPPIVEPMGGTGGAGGVGGMAGAGAMAGGGMGAVAGGGAPAAGSGGSAGNGGSDTAGTAGTAGAGGSDTAGSGGSAGTAGTAGSGGSEPDGGAPN